MEELPECARFLLVDPRIAMHLSSTVVNVLRLIESKNCNQNGVVFEALYRELTRGSISDLTRIYIQCVQ